MNRFSFFAGVLGGILSLSGATAEGKDHFLVLAGGYSAASNQVSLEKNVLFFREVRGEVVPDSGLTEYFSSGNAGIRSVQFESPEAEIAPPNEYMARLFGSTKYLTLQYRAHDLGKLAGGTSPANLDRWFDEKGKQLQPGDRLVIYATSHGGKSRDKKQPRNTTLYMWNRQSVDVQRLQANLKKLPEGVSVVLVMAQCFSGGFASSIFNDTDPDAGDFERPVCGFFATVDSREAAGCTPDINEENYDEFSSHFWAAIAGRDRMGQVVDSADFDENGEVSFEEAHAFTVITSRNIDIPIRTSGAYLRERAGFGDDKGAEDDRLLDRYTDFSKTLKLAGAADRAVLLALSERLKLGGEARYAAAEKKAGEIEKRRTELQKQLTEKRRIYDGHRNAIRESLFGRWPELANVLTEQSVRLLTEESGDFVGAVENHPRFEAWNQLEEEREKIADARFALEKEWVQYIRFMRAHNNVILAENLRLTGTPEERSRFQYIRDVETSGMGAAEASSTSGAP